MIVLQALVTALLSGLCAGLVSFGLTERRDRAELRLKKLEEAAEAADTYIDYMTTLYTTWAYGLASGRLGAEHINAYWGTVEDKRDSLRTRAILLVNIWSPSSKPELNSLIDCLQKMITLNAEMLNQGLATEALTQMARKQSSQAVESVKAKNALINQIIATAKTLADRPTVFDEVLFAGRAIKAKIGLRA